MYRASKYFNLSSLEENAQVSNAFVAALTASSTSSTPPKDITAHYSSVEGSITFKSLGFFGETHSPFI